jgi:hypothetical protein
MAPARRADLRVSDWSSFLRDALGLGPGRQRPGGSRMEDGDGVEGGGGDAVVVVGGGPRLRVNEKTCFG